MRTVNEILAWLDSVAGFEGATMESRECASGAIALIRDVMNTQAVELVKAVAPLCRPNETLFEAFQRVTSQG